VRAAYAGAAPPLLRASPRLVVDVSVEETGALGSRLAQGSVDFVLLDRVVARPDVEHHTLGSEELVLVESRQHRSRDDVYLDHDPDDTTTLRFLARSGIKTRWVRRSFFDDIYGVLDAAASGLGRAVVPRHLLVRPVADALRIVPDTKMTRSPVLLHFYRQPSYSRAHDAVREALVDGVRKALARPQKTGTTT
jgi:DNA-binding transcriptional LysR family regulator